MVKSKLKHICDARLMYAMMIDLTGFYMRCAFNCTLSKVEADDHEIASLWL